MSNFSLGRGAKATRLPSASAKILGSVVFWVVVLLFLFTATQVLGLDIFTTWLSRVVDYLPTVFVGALIIVAGFLFSKLAREIVEAVASGAGESQRALWCKEAYLLLQFSLALNRLASR